MESNPQMPSQSTPNQGEYPPLPYQGYPPSAQGYPHQPCQQVPPQPNQGFVPDLQLARPHRVSYRSRGLTMVLRGVILVVGGIVLSLISYSCASSAADNGSAGYYTIFTGAVVIGIIYAIIGFFIYGIEGAYISQRESLSNCKKSK